MQRKHHGCTKKSTRFFYTLLLELPQPSAQGGASLPIRSKHKAIQRHPNASRQTQRMGFYLSQCMGMTATTGERAAPGGPADDMPISPINPPSAEKPSSFVTFECMPLWRMLI